MNQNPTDLNPKVQKYVFCNIHESSVDRAHELDLNRTGIFQRTIHKCVYIESTTRPQPDEMCVNGIEWRGKKEDIIYNRIVNPSE